MKTNVSDTSIESYYEHIVPSGKLAAQNSAAAAWFLRQTEPKSIREMGEAIGLEQGSASRVCNGLVAAKVIVQVGTKPNIFGKQVKALMHSARTPRQ